MGEDGTVRFVDMVQGRVCCCIEPATQRQACTSMSVDRRGNYAALITQEGEVQPITELLCCCSAPFLAVLNLNTTLEDKALFNQLAYNGRIVNRLCLSMLA